MTGKGANTFATYYYPHVEQPECTKDLDVYDGVVCDPSVQIRRIAITATPSYLMSGMELGILKYDDSVVAAQSNVTAWLIDNT